jgi:uncharacterized protein affecting Mg2+/Co2+ transport
MESTPGNPFQNDAYNMGVKIGTNVHVMMGNYMMGNHDNKHCPYLIVVDTTTGERLLIEFPTPTNS